VEEWKDGRMGRIVQWNDGAMERWITQYSKIPTFQYSKTITYYPEEP